MFGHRLGIFILNKRIKKKVNSIKDEINAVKSQEVQLSKITETARLLGWEFETDNNPYGVYVLKPPLKLNE